MEARIEKLLYAARWVLLPSISWAKFSLSETFARNQRTAAII